MPFSLISRRSQCYQERQKVNSTKVKNRLRVLLEKHKFDWRKIGTWKSSFRKFSNYVVHTNRIAISQWINVTLFRSLLADPYTGGTLWQWLNSVDANFDIFLTSHVSRILIDYTTLIIHEVIGKMFRIWYFHFLKDGAHVRFIAPIRVETNLSSTAVTFQCHRLFPRVSCRRFFHQRIPNFVPKVIFLLSFQSFVQLLPHILGVFFSI